MIYVYRSKASQGARQLAESLDGRRIRQQTNIDRLTRPGDTVVCWGESWAKPGVTVLNGGPIRSKLTDAQTLSAASIRTVQVNRTRPMTEGSLTPAGDDPAEHLYSVFATAIADAVVEHDLGARAQIVIDGARHLSNVIGNYLDATRTPAPQPIRTPSVPDPLWFGRMNNHVGGLDLLNPPANPDYWVKKEDIRDEYRLHIFDGRSIRAGKKGPRTGVPQSPWIRSFDGGWKIVYDRYESTAPQRQLAAAAVTSLGLTFGAVDLGLLADGSLIVLEVNRAPGLEGGTIEAYARAIERWEEATERAAA